MTPRGSCSAFGRKLEASERSHFDLELGGVCLTASAVAVKA